MHRQLRSTGPGAGSAAIMCAGAIAWALAAAFGGAACGKTAAAPNAGRGSEQEIEAPASQAPEAKPSLAPVPVDGSEPPCGGAPDGTLTAPASGSHDSPVGGIHAVELEASRYGRFEMAIKVEEGGPTDTCVLSFGRSPEAPSQVLSSWCDNLGGGIGIGLVGAVEKVGTLSFPVVDPDGDEFHLFAIAAMRGGNGGPGFDYFAVVVRPDDLWATLSSFASGQLTVGSVAGARPGRIVLEEPPTTTATGARYTLRFGRADRAILPMVLSWIVKKKRIVLVGRLSPGSRATAFRPEIDVDATFVVIDHDGPCEFPPLHDRDAADSPVTMTADISTWSDGRTTVDCVAIQP